MKSNQLFELCYDGVYFFFCVILTEGKTNSNKVGVIVYSANNMRTVIGTAGAGTPTRCANMIYVEIKKNHLRFFSFGKCDAQYSVQALTLGITVE